MSVSTRIILDPTAHHHRTGRVWQSCQRELLRELAPVEVTIAESAAEAEEAARVGAMKGFGKIIAAGGAATAHGAVNGLMSLPQSHRAEMALGFLSIIRPGDWSRTIAFPRELPRQVEVLKAGHTLPYDVGRVSFMGADSATESRYFLNGAGFGLAPLIRHELLGGREHLRAALVEVARALGDVLLNRGPQVKLEGDSGLLYSGPCPLGLIMGGRFYAALGEIAPEASPTDGALDVVWVASPSRWEQLAQLCGLILRRSPRGSAVPGRARSQVVRVSSVDGPVFVEADGQPLGHLPATFTIEQRALPMIVPEVGVKVKKARFAPLPDPSEGHLAGNLRDMI